MTSEYDDLLYEFEALPQISMSIFNIAGYPRYENVSSNILAFYFDPNNEHGLGELLYFCLMDLTYPNEARPYKAQGIRVQREVSTNKGKRIDILIRTDSEIIAIE